MSWGSSKGAGMHGRTVCVIHRLVIHGTKTLDEHLARNHKGQKFLDLQASRAMIGISWCHEAIRFCKKPSRTPVTQEEIDSILADFGKRVAEAYPLA